MCISQIQPMHVRAIVGLLRPAPCNYKQMYFTVIMKIYQTLYIVL